MIGPLSDRDDILCLWALLAISYGKFNLLPIGQRAKAIAFDSAEVNKDIWTTFLLDKAVSLALVKPLYGTGYCRHTYIPFKLYMTTGVAALLLAIYE